jgi:hypothetical protein
MKNYRILNLGLSLFPALALGVIPDAAGLAQANRPAENTIHVAALPASVLVEQIRLPAKSLNYDKSSTIITQSASGLRWQASYLADAVWETPRPVDWDGASDVELRLYFYPTTSTAGNVDFFIRPRGYNPGDGFADASSMNGTAVAVAQSSQVRMETFTIPAAKFGTKVMWVISLQRDAIGETYPGDVILMAVELYYNAYTIRLPLVSK